MTTLLAAALAVALQETPNVAQVESAFGGVRLIDAGGAGRTPVRIGRRAENLDVHDGDWVKTGEGAQAVIVFPDRTRLTLMEKSEARVQQDRTTRRVRLSFGDLVAEVERSRGLRTEFETSLGRIEADEAVFKLSLGAVSLKIETLDGVARFRNEKFSSGFSVTRRQALRFVESPLIVEADADGGGAIEGRIASRQIRLTAGNRLMIREPRSGATAVRAEVDTGPIDVDGRAVADAFECPIEVEKPKPAEALVKERVDPGTPAGAPIPGGSEARPAEPPAPEPPIAENPEPVRKGPAAPRLAPRTLRAFEGSDIMGLGTARLDEMIGPRRPVRRPKAEPPAPPSEPETPAPIAETVPVTAEETPKGSVATPDPQPSSDASEPQPTAEAPAPPPARPRLEYDAFTGGFVRRRPGGAAALVKPGGLHGRNLFKPD